jgi:hypothetical protein
MKASACFAISALRSCMSLTTFTSPNVSPDTYRSIVATRLIHAHTDETCGFLAKLVAGCWERREGCDRPETGMEIWHYLFR